ncbi:hypothetical protein SNEBB_009889, partial [Seison nebaliae]
TILKMRAFGLNNILLSKNLFKTLRSAPIRSLKEIVYEKNEDGKEITIRGKQYDKTAENVLKDENGKLLCLCRLEDKGIRIHYTDVLVLRQFINSDGDVLPRHLTGICYEKFQLIHRLVDKAKRAGLLAKEEVEDVEGFQKRNTFFYY